MKLLTIETTCDETATAVTDDRLSMLGAAVASQDRLHERFRGVATEIASQAHIECILPVIDEAAGGHLGQERSFCQCRGDLLD